jgi:aminoglycoside 2'-N-acetyltransferase I
VRELERAGARERVGRAGLDREHAAGWWHAARGATRRMRVRDKRAAPAGRRRAADGVRRSLDDRASDGRRMIELQVAHTADLAAGTLRAARTLVFDAFGSGTTDDDWEHALGGVHALAWEGEQLVGHAAVVQRRLLYRDRALRTGYVEDVVVRSNRRRRGYADAMMSEIERIIRGAYRLGALGASDDGKPLYESRGWQPWRGETWGLTPAGRVRTPSEDDSVYVLEVDLSLDRSEPLTCDWREGDLW